MDTGTGLPHAAAIGKKKGLPTGVGTALDPLVAAKLAKLRYVSDDLPGITRHQARRGFDYRLPDGEFVRDIDTLNRIRSLVIPPAWTAVWICPYANGHIQAIGRDKRGRKQYRYHPRWREVRDESKYEKILIFGRVLPVIRERVGSDLRRRGLSRERVLAAVVRLMEITLFRIGNSERQGKQELRPDDIARPACRDRRQLDSSEFPREARDTPRNRYHRSAAGSHHQRVPRPARLRAVPIRRRGRQPACYQFENVNDYLREISGEEITAKDFRTWAATNLAALALQEFEFFDTEAKKKQAVVRAVEKVAKHLGNTPAICRRCYIHPAIFDGYFDGTLLSTLKGQARNYLAENLGEMSTEETAVAAFLSLRLSELERDQKRMATGADARAKSLIGPSLQ